MTCTQLFFVWIIPVALQLAIFWVAYHYVSSATRLPEAGNQLRWITTYSLNSYSHLAFLVGGFCAAGLWALLPTLYGELEPLSKPLFQRLSATGLIIGAVIAGAFIGTYYRIYEVHGRPDNNDDGRGKLSNGELYALVFLGISSMTGVVQGAYFLALGLWF